MSGRRPSVTAGYSGTPLAGKLGIGPGCRLFLHDAPRNYPQLVAPLPAGVQIVTAIGAHTDLIHLFATRRAALAQALRGALNAMRDDAVIWVSWPKKASGVATDVTEDAVRELALPLQLVDIKVCAVDETWSGLKLVVRRAARAQRRRHGTRGGRTARA
jgi:hypothetical protein